MAFDSYSMLGIYGAAVLLGAAHALEPGHGKTVVAAYLVGSRGRNLDALLLGIVVTFTHSFSIILLGLVAKASARYLTDQQLHGYLGIVASLLILVIGVWLIKSRWQALHDPSGGHGHRHFFHSHNHDGHHHHEVAPVEHEHPSADGTVVRHSHVHAGEDEPGSVGLWGLIGLGISGGIVPCPAALALLLAAVSVGNLAKGLVLVLVFSLGLAASLVTIGLLVVNGVRVTGRFLDTERYAPKIALASAVIVTLVGIYTLYSSVSHL
ncbi:MAG TPA: sulfite exporter TauE/SafE family protein [Geobacteraceae bacterium]